ncbi:MAG TPA: radical SAM protein [Candidatus Brocadiia bacterium]|nr:radical SAM protein [Candidatus Brocadiia bacterium]
MSDIRIDGHKLMFHPERVAAWLRGENVYPIYVEIGPSGACNNRCCFCAFDYRGYKSEFLETDVLCRAIEEMGEHGVKSVMCAGEGEPLLHQDIVRIISQTKTAGIDVALSTNASLLEQRIAEGILPCLSWMRLSINAATPETYAGIHGCGQERFKRVIENVALAVEIRNRLASPCTLGVQIVLIPQNVDEIERLAQICSEIGVDYLTVKPCIPHPHSGKEFSPPFELAFLRELKEKADAYQSPSFKVYFRLHGFEKIRSSERRYDHCLGLPFFAKISCDGGVYSCGPHLGDPEYCYGNIYEQSFSGIWEGQRRLRIIEKVQKKLDCSECMKNCRLDEINAYLWELTHPGPHANFI